MRRPTSWPIVPLLWLATALRFLRLDAQSFWNDEGNSARLAERSVRLIVEGAAADVHPPLYYLMLAGWRQLLGDSEFALRALSGFAGILLAAGVYALTRKMSSTPIASLKSPKLAKSALVSNLTVPVLATLFAAVHPALIYYSQETRMYALLGLWAVLSTLLLHRLLPHLSRPRSRSLFLWAGGYLMITIAGLYTHYFYPAVLLAHNLIVLIQLIQSRPLYPLTRSLLLPIRRWLVLMLAALLPYLPWLPILLRQTAGRAPDSITAAEFIPNAARWLVVGETVSYNNPWLWIPVAATFLLALFAVIIPLHAANPRQSSIPQPQSSGPQSPISNPQSPVILNLLPPLLIFLLGATRPAYYKFMIVVPPFLGLLAARGLVDGWRWASNNINSVRLAARAGLGLLLAFALWGSAQSLQNMYFDPAFGRADYRGIAARIAAEAHTDAGIILNAANQWEVFTYYHRQGAPVYPLPRGQPDAQGIEAELQEIAARHNRLYALFWGEVERDPQRLVERWLDAHAFKASEEWVGDVRFVTYAVPSEPATSRDVVIGVLFGDSITLTGYTVRPSEVAPGDIVQITLFWQTARALDTRYKIFLHLLAREGGAPVAQRDAEPVGNLAPTSTWQPGEQVVDNHGLLIPPDLPAGRYQLSLGLYALDDPTARLPITSRSEAHDSSGSSDSLPLATITVR